MIFFLKVEEHLKDPIYSKVICDLTAPRLTNYSELVVAPKAFWVALGCSKKLLRSIAFFNLSATQRVAQKDGNVRPKYHTKSL